jgi:ABC-type amino acid transport substrate-binding protein
LAQAPTPDALARIHAKGNLVVLAYPTTGSSFLHPKDDGFDGLEYGLLESFARKLGVTLEIKPVATWRDLVPALLAGEGDLLAATFTATPERARTLALSESYFPVLTMVITRRESPIRTPADLRGKVASTFPGSSFEEVLRGLDGVHVEPTAADFYDRVVDGRADFSLAESVSVDSVVARHPELHASFALPGAQRLVFAAPPGSSLIAPLDAHIAEALQTGYLYQLVKRYFGARGAELYLQGRRTLEQQR